MDRRRLFTTAKHYAEDHTRAELRWLVKTGRCVRVHHRVYADGPGEPNAFEKSLGALLATQQPAAGMVAGELHQFDGIRVHVVQGERWQRKLMDDAIWVVDGYLCTSPLQTLLDLASLVDDDVWEQALESTLRARTVDLSELEALLPSLSKSRHHGVPRIRRVLGQRPMGARPTESLLETLFVQLARLVPGLPPPTRQFVVYDEFGVFAGRVDFAWPELGLFIELDGEHHVGQPVYDANRETAVVAATGWLCGRFRWTEVRHHPKATAARLARLVEQARRRPVAQV